MWRKFLQKCHHITSHLRSSHMKSVEIKTQNLKSEEDKLHQMKSDLLKERNILEQQRDQVMQGLAHIPYFTLLRPLKNCYKLIIGEKLFVRHKMM